MEIAQGIEAASQDVQKLQQQPQSVQLVQQKPQSKPAPATHPRSQQSPCYRCGGNHHQSFCRFRDAVCRSCGKKGHISRVCKSKSHFHRAKPVKPQQNYIQEKETTPSVPGTNNSSVSNEDIYHLFTVRNKSNPIKVKLKINNSRVPMEVDTGASISLINETTYSQIASNSPLKPTTTELSTYTGEHLPILGIADEKVEYNSQSAELSVIVVKGSGPNLLGRDWLSTIRLDWSKINSVRSNLSLESLLQRYPTVFSPKLGRLRNIKVKIFVPADVKPRFFRPRTVTYFMRDKVNQELDRLVTDGIISPVPHAEWAAPIVPVLKSDGQRVRICGDYKVTVNREAKPDSYPLPYIDDLFANLSGGKVFSKLDLVSAYQQIELDENSKQYTTINISRGLFQYHRLPFGISAAPSILENVLRDLPGVSVYLDNILISGSNMAEHLRNLERVLQRLEEAGLTLQKDKCAFALSSVEYLGHNIDGNGLHPSPRKIKAIQEAPVPKNLTELR